jgi:hypothetical protein
MPKKGYKQTLEHIKKAAAARGGKLIGRNNPAYIVVDGNIRKQIIDLILYSESSISQISSLVGLSKHIIKRIAREAGSSIFNKLLVNNRRFISISKLGNLNPMKKTENILKRKQKVDYKVIAKKVSQTRKRLFREGNLKHWNKVDPVRWRNLLVEHQKRMKENNPMFNPNVVKKVSASNNKRGIYQESRDRMKMLWERPDFRKKSIKRLKISNPMKREEVVVKNWRSHQHRPTNIEKKFIELIKIYSLPIEYVGNANLFIGRKNPDFKVINQNKVIEVTSDAYGRNTNDYGESSIDYYKNRGYDCLILWSNCRRYKDELKNENLTETLQKIKGFINDRK